MVIPLPWMTIDWRSAWSEYTEEAPAEARAEVSGLFAEQRLVGKPCRPRVISCCLFCKPVDQGPVWAVPTFENVESIPARGGTTNWWQAYAAPLFRNLHQLPYTFPDVEVHVYLASDLDWLAETLALPQVVVHLMQHPSFNAGPGMMWRFLAHDLPHVTEVFTVDAEDDWSGFARLQRVADWRRSDLKFFRYVNPMRLTHGARRSRSIDRSGEVFFSIIRSPISACVKPAKRLSGWL
jgi:hypothetical protein